MATRPTIDDLLGWLNLQTVPSEQAFDVYSEALDTALDLVESRINLPEGTTDEDYPQRVRTAVILQAARLAKRSTTPTGVEGFDAGAVVVRVGRFDPDIEQLLARYMRVDGFF